MKFFEVVEEARNSDEYLFGKLRSEVSEAISHAMREDRVSPKQLAGVSGVTHQHILRILQDDANVTLATISKLADALKRDVSLRFEKPGQRNWVASRIGWDNSIEHSRIRTSPVDAFLTDATSDAGARQVIHFQS